MKLQILNLAAKLYITNSKQTKLLCQYVFNLAKYDQNYDIRDRARFLRSLVLPGEKSGALSKHAKKIFLAAKPAPVLESRFKGACLSSAEKLVFVPKPCPSRDKTNELHVLSKAKNCLSQNSAVHFLRLRFRPGPIPTGDAVAPHQQQGGGVPGAVRVARGGARPVRPQRRGAHAVGRHQDQGEEEAREEKVLLLGRGYEFCWSVFAFAPLATPVAFPHGNEPRISRATKPQFSRQNKRKESDTFLKPADF